MTPAGDVRAEDKRRARLLGQSCFVGGVVILGGGEIRIGLSAPKHLGLLRLG